MSYQSERCLSFTPSTNPLMRRCLVRWQAERLFPPCKPRERGITGFSSNLRFLRVITSAYFVRAKLSSARNFSKSSKKPRTALNALGVLMNGGIRVYCLPTFPQFGARQHGLRRCTALCGVRTHLVQGGQPHRDLLGRRCTKGDLRQPARK